MRRFHPKTIADLRRLQCQAQQLAVKNRKHAQLSIFLAGYLKPAGGVQ